MFIYNAKLNGFVNHDSNIDFWGNKVEPIKRNAELVSSNQAKNELKTKILEQAVRALEIKHGLRNDSRSN